MTEPEQQQQEQQSALRERKEEEGPEPPSLPTTKVIPLIELLCKFNGGCTEHSLHKHMRKRNAENLAYLQQLAAMTEEQAAAAQGQREFLMDDDDDDNFVRTKPTTIVTSHLKHRHQYEIYPAKITQLGADRIFALRGFLQVTIRQYYYVRHRINLRYPHLPLVCVQGGRNQHHHYYYPLECLEVLEWEKKKESSS